MFFLDIYTARAHDDGTVDQFIEEVLAFPHKQQTEDLLSFLDAVMDHETAERLPGRCRADSRRPLRGARGGGPPALPGDSGRMERPRGCLLARG